MKKNSRRFCKLGSRHLIMINEGKPVLDAPVACICCPRKDCLYRSGIAKALEWGDVKQEGEEGGKLKLRRWICPTHRHTPATRIKERKILPHTHTPKMRWKSTKNEFFSPYEYHKKKIIDHILSSNNIPTQYLTAKKTGKELRCSPQTVGSVLNQMYEEGIIDIWNPDTTSRRCYVVDVEKIRRITKTGDKK